MRKTKIIALVLAMILFIGNVFADEEVVTGVPDTFSMQSAALIAIAMFDIALGIGIFIYVKKNKTKE